MNCLKINFLLTALCCLLLCSCLSQQLASQSGLYKVQLDHTYKIPVDGYWTWGKGNPYANQKEGTIYIAPVDVSQVQEDHPEIAERIVTQMHKLMVAELGRILKDYSTANNCKWELTEDATSADIRIDLAIVELRTQKPLLRIAGKIAGPFAPTGVGTAVEMVAKGDITLECTIRDNHNGQLMVAFKDSNRAKMRFYKKETYLRTGHVDANLRLWSHRTAMLCRHCAPDYMGGKSFQEAVDERPLSDIIMSHLK